MDVSQRLFFAEHALSLASVIITSVQLIDFFRYLSQNQQNKSKAQYYVGGGVNLNLAYCLNHTGNKEKQHFIMLFRSLSVCTQSTFNIFVFQPKRALTTLLRVQWQWLPAILYKLGGPNFLKWPLKPDCQIFLFIGMVSQAQDLM